MARESECDDPLRSRVTYRAGSSRLRRSTSRRRDTFALSRVHTKGSGGSKGRRESVDGAASHCADAYFARPAWGRWGGRSRGRTFTGHGVVRVLVNKVVCVESRGESRAPRTSDRVYRVFVQRDAAVASRRVASYRIVSSSLKISSGLLR